MKILLADDTSTDLFILVSYLRKMGHEVISCEDGKQAFELFKLHQPDLVVLDVIMPEMDGHEVARKIRGLGDQWVPIIFLSAKTRAEDIVAGIEAGGDDYLTKPVDQTVLIAKMHAMQRISEMRKRLLNMTLELDQANRELSRLVNVDGLTGLASRRFLDQYLENEVHRLGRTHEPLTLIMADIDHFKAYNDHFGHIAGDECLKTVSATLQAQLHRPADFAARYGGEEFCIVLPETKTSGGILIAEKIRSALEKLNLPQSPKIEGGFVTLSLGVAGCPPNKPCNSKELLKKADEALYMAKQAGRNQVKVAS